MDMTLAQNCLRYLANKIAILFKSKGHNSTIRDNSDMKKIGSADPKMLEVC